MKFLSRMILLAIIISICGLAAWNYWETQENATTESLAANQNIKSIIDLYTAMESAKQNIKNMNYSLEMERCSYKGSAIRAKINVFQMGTKYRYELDNGSIVGYNGKKLWIYAKSDNSIIIVDADNVSPVINAILPSIEDLRKRFSENNSVLSAGSTTYQIDNLNTQEIVQNIVLINKLDLDVIESKTFQKDGTEVSYKFKDIKKNVTNMNDIIFEPKLDAKQSDKAYSIWMLLGIDALDNGYFLIAEEYLQKALNSNPSPDASSIILVRLGEAEFKQSQYDKAVDFYSKATLVNGIKPQQLAIANHFLGFSFLTLDKYDEAIKNLLIASHNSSNPLSSETYELLGIAYHKQGNLNEAKIAFGQSLSKTGDNSQRQRIENYMTRFLK
ncbi:tetratricopeptide repeat protein [Sporomusa aerivorans]|uniref:tetratricopeptide repeat protein n=1 Tax=Sporomusa aerivorans TaxID=204936 RepID=UPI00352A7DCB